MMLKPYTVNEVADIIQTALDNAGDDKGHGVQSALEDLQALVYDLDQHKDTTLELKEKSNRRFIESINKQ